MTGKVVQRALRGHFLVNKGLHSQLITEITQEDPDIQIPLDQAEELYSFLRRGETTLADSSCSEVFIKLETATEKKRCDLAQTSKPYGKNVKVLINVDLTGRWLMHLKAIFDC
ncbi:hypothetical protein DPMN_034201 [Dreissena polymorpha]|uniref:Uncharacterized protein n=1 Tax=Dreissena polymorpha TaxID=45954 RepID=A0A9D4RLQ7_DREPO|nr:hypothetical protein DPMN_034201 [Dreissena polymorpha]